MPSMMAIVSKAVFEKAARGKAVGDVWPTDRYISQNKALANLAGGDLYLVTVRPPDEALWLVAVLARPAFDGTQWTAAANTHAICDISQLKRTLRFANGQGLPDKAGALAMSLQTPRVLTGEDLALLRAALGAQGARDDAASAKRGKTDGAKRGKTDSAVSAKRGADPLAKAVAQLQAGQPATALELLLDAWADHPHPRLAELIATLSNEVRTPTPANLRGKTAAARAAWDEHATDARAADLPMLLESLCDVTSNDAMLRLAVVAEWMPDPRVDAALVDVLEAVPYRATSTQKFWRRLFPLLREIRDPRQIARVDQIGFDAVAATMAAWLTEQRDKLRLALTENRGDVAEPARLAELAATIGKQHLEGAADRASVEQLFRAVYESPADDGLRSVLADALIERNDPRGEFITVQMRLAEAPTDRAARAREKELLEAHAKQWLGELAPVLMADVTFERGFLAACKVDNSKLDRVARLVGHPAWSTVHTIEGSAAIALHPVMRSLRKLVFHQSHARRHEKLPDAWRDLLVTTERPVEELLYRHIHRERQWLDTVEGRQQVFVSDQSEVEALCAATALPKLRRLALHDTPVLYIHKLVRAPVLERLEHLSFIYDRNNRLDARRTSPLVDFAQLLGEARVPALRFEIGSFHETTLELERGTRGYARARLQLGPTMQSNWSMQLVDEAIRVLDSLPKTVRELRATATRWTETQQVARLRAAATQMNLDVCEVQ